MNLTIVETRILNATVRRWAWNIFCILSLLVLVLGMAIWVRSYFVTADIERWNRQTDLTQNPPLTRSLGYGIGWGPGSCGLFHSRGESSVPRELARTWIYREFGPKRVLLTPAAPGDRLNLRFGGFQLLYRVEATADGWLSLGLLVLPCWLFLFAAIPPVMRWRYWRKLRQAPAGHGPLED